jgi:hypothetical protein
MTLRTTTDLFHGKALLPLPALHAERIPCRSARAREDDFRCKMGELTAATAGLQPSSHFHNLLWNGMVVLRLPLPRVEGAPVPILINSLSMCPSVERRRRRRSFCDTVTFPNEPLLCNWVSRNFRDFLERSTNANTIALRPDKFKELWSHFIKRRISGAFRRQLQ